MTANDVLTVLDRLARDHITVWVDGGWGLVLVGSDGRRVDLHPVVFDHRGDGWQPLGEAGLNTSRSACRQACDGDRGCDQSPRRAGSQAN